MKRRHIAILLRREAEHIERGGRHPCVEDFDGARLRRQDEEEAEELRLAAAELDKRPDDEVE